MRPRCHRRRTCRPQSGAPPSPRTRPRPPSHRPLALHRNRSHTRPVSPALCSPAVGDVANAGPKYVPTISTEVGTNDRPGAPIACAAPSSARLHVERVIVAKSPKVRRPPCLRPPPCALPVSDRTFTTTDSCRVSPSPPCVRRRSPTAATRRSAPRLLSQPTTSGRRANHANGPPSL